jgi:lysophospholipase L1-like esterase
MERMDNVRRTAIVIATIAGLLTGCGDDDTATPAATASPVASSNVTAPSSTAPQPTSSPTDNEVDGVELVVIGDSLITPTDGCSGCTGFVEQYADHLEKTLDVPVNVSDVPVGGVPDALDLVSSDAEARGRIAEADVIVVEVGFNNALPDPDTGIGCGGSYATGYVTWSLTTDDACLAEGVATYGSLYGQIFTTIKELRADEPTVFVVTNTLNGNLNTMSSEGLMPDATKAEHVDEVKAWAVAAYDRWNTMLGNQAAAAGFELVDIYHEFNGLEGDQELGPLSIDGAHPSQAGHDLIAAKLAEVDLSVLAS